MTGNGFILVYVFNNAEIMDLSSRIHSQVVLITKITIFNYCLCAKIKQYVGLWCSKSNTIDGNISGTKINLLRYFLIHSRGGGRWLEVRVPKYWSILWPWTCKLLTSPNALRSPKHLVYATLYSPQWPYVTVSKDVDSVEGSICNPEVLLLFILLQCN